MSKLSLFFASLVPAVPAGFLAYLLVMAFLNHNDSMTTMLQAIVGGALACAAVLVLTPVGVLVMKTPSGAKKKSAEPEAGGDSMEELDAFDADTEEASFGDDEDLVDLGDGGFDVDSETDDFDDFDFEDEDRKV